MKMKNLLGMVAVLALSVCCTVTAYADNSYSIGKPIDISTGQEVDDLKAGQKVMFPLDFTTTDANLRAYTAKVGYDTTVLKSGGFVDEAGKDSSLDVLTDAEFDVITEKGGFIYVYGRDDIGAVDCLGTWKRTGFVGEGTGRIDENPTGYLILQWRTPKIDLSKDNVEAYLCFTVLADVPSDKLNHVLFTPNLAPGTSTVNDFAQLDDATTVKANACVSAFNVVVDPADLGGWLQKLTVTVGKKATVELKEYYEEGSTYVFPVRVTKNSGGAGGASIDVTATVTDDEAGNGTSKEVKYATTGITFGTPTTYANPELTVVK